MLAYTIGYWLINAEALYESHGQT